MSSGVAEKLLNEIDLKVESIEDKELTRWSRFKRRYFSGRFGAGYFIGGNVTLVQIAAGKKFLTWFALKFPTTTGLAAKLWSAVSSFFVGMYQLAFHT